MEGAVGTTEPGNMMSSSEDTQLRPAASLTYIARIAKVILSSPSKKLKLASIYSAMEERFPYLRNGGPGWKNSVRHNLSVNDCFMKVDRCEDGRGHYWGVHQAHLKDFQQGNFRHYRRTRDRRERYTGNTKGDAAQRKSHCLHLRRFFESRAFPCVGTCFPLEEPQEHQLSPFWVQMCCQPHWVSVCWVPSSGWMNQTANLPGSYCRTTVGSQYASEPVISRPQWWDVNDVTLTNWRESYDSRVTIPQIRAGLPVCWGVPPVLKH